MKKNNNVNNTIDLLYDTKTTCDLWDEFIVSEAKEKSSKWIQNFVAGIQYKFRMIGPFLRVKRFFLGNEIRNAYSVDKNINFENIINNKKKEDIDKLCEVLKKCHYHASNIAAIRDRLNLSYWQKCILINAFFFSPDRGIKLVAMGHTIINSLVNVGGYNTKICGINACNINLLKTNFSNNKMDVNYKLSFDQCKNMDRETLHQIFINGLIDIPSYIKNINENNLSGYYYKISENYKMQSELFNAFMVEAKDIEESSHFEKAEESFEELPPDAFEHRNKMNESINSLEVI